MDTGVLLPTMMLEGPVKVDRGLAVLYFKMNIYKDRQNMMLVHASCLGFSNALRQCAGKLPVQF